MKKSILTVIGTRPEAIKLAPVLSVMKHSKVLQSKVCVTGQHTDLLDPFLINHEIAVDYRFENAEVSMNLHQSAAYMLREIASVLEKSKPDIVLIQGDTTTAFVGALAAFYARIPVAHVEAGLRTGNLHSPWPEEAHRCLVDRLTTFFFSPTEKARDALLAEGIPSEKIWVVGNTSIDALRLVRQPLSSSSTSRTVVATIHRRENQGEALKEICHAMRSLAQQFPDVIIRFVRHPNPAIYGPATEMLSGMANIELIEPMDHTSFVRLLDESLFVITDSGGIQEEAPFMGKPIVIVRNQTERPEGILAGTARLVGIKSSDIVACCQQLLQDEEMLNTMSKVHFPYGDGYAAERIVTILEKELT